MSVFKNNNYNQNIFYYEINKKKIKEISNGPLVSKQKTSTGEVFGKAKPNDINTQRNHKTYREAVTFMYMQVFYGRRILVVAIRTPSPI